MSPTGATRYSTFVAMLRRWLGADESEPAVAVRMKLRARLGDRLPDALPGLARLLGVGIDPIEEARLAALPPEALATEVRGAHAAWLERRVERVSAVAKVWITDGSVPVFTDTRRLRASHRGLFGRASPECKYSAN